MNEHIHYKVTWGDTLYGISSRFEIEPHIIKYRNHVNDIYIGQVLTIPINSPQIKSVNIQTKQKTIEYYLKRHANKKHIFNYYTYKKSHYH